MSFGAPPDIPAALQIYNSYAEDPKWQKTFTIIWCSFLAATAVFSIPRVFHALRSGSAFTSVFGVKDDWGIAYSSLPTLQSRQSHQKPSYRYFNIVLSFIGSFLLWSPPGVGLNVGQIIICVGYILAVVACIVTKAPLYDNPNRAGFLALAQLPVVFLFATKNSLLSLILGPGNGYEKLNYLHRWAGRGMLLGGVVHGALWIRNHLQYNIPILTQQKEQSGVASLALLCLIALFSVRPIRSLFYQVFFYTHVLLFVSFFITLCFHTPYASPWIFPPLAFYGFDMLMRMFRYRVKNATLESSGNEMTLIRIHGCDGGWIAGQHVRLRIYFEGRIFESHSLTIASAPPSISCSSSRDILLGARIKGDWTRALSTYVRNEQDRLASLTEKKTSQDIGVPALVMLDGPYGGCSLDLGLSENVFLFAGGAGVTFTLGLLDDIVGRCVRLGRPGGERTRRIEFVWAVRSYGCVHWFAPQLMQIAKTAAISSIDLQFSLFVTCLCNPEDLPKIPNLVVSLERPSAHRLLSDFIMSTPPVSAPNKALEASTSVGGGGVAVCASGPESLTREMSNAVAALALRHSQRTGGIFLHTEAFSI